MSEWPGRTPGDLVTLQRGIDLPASQRANGRVPIMGSFGITGHHDRAAMSGPGVTVGRSGASIGVVSYINGDYWPLNTCLYVKDFHGNNPRFTHYLLSTLNLAHYNSGSAQPSLNRNYIHPIPLRFPAREEQDQIVELLASLDDKIELNRRMNETLEAMARAIFKDWFVDFGPTRAKAEGRAPYLARELWDLFPDALDDSDKPSGWRNGKLNDLIVLQRGFDLPKPKRVKGKFPILAASGVNGTHNEAKAPGPGVTTGRSGVIGKAFYVHEDFWPLNTSLWVKQYRNSSPAHAYFLIQTLDFASFNSGSAVPALNRNHVHDLPMAVPRPETIQGFDRFIGPLLQRQRLNDVENTALARTRDFLLPKLVSGEIRLRDAEKVVGEVA